jgi:hypothetical protein
MNVKFISYVLFIFVFYYVINFAIFDVMALDEGSYIYVAGLNMSLCFLFSVASNQEKPSFQDSFVEPINEKRGYHVSLLLLCAWVLFYEEVALQIHFSKLSGFALLCTYPSISYFLSQGNSEGSLDDGKSFYESNIIRSIVHAIIWLIVGIGSVSVIFFGEWVSPIR